MPADRCWELAETLNRLRPGTGHAVVRLAMLTGHFSRSGRVKPIVDPRLVDREVPQRIFGTDQLGHSLADVTQ